MRHQKNLLSVRLTSGERSLFKFLRKNFICRFYGTLYLRYGTRGIKSLVFFIPLANRPTEDLRMVNISTVVQAAHTEKSMPVNKTSTTTANIPWRLQIKNHLFFKEKTVKMLCQDLFQIHTYSHLLPVFRGSNSDDHTGSSSGLGS